MEIRISAKTVEKIKEKHGLTWFEVASIYESGEDLLEYKKGETGISFGRTCRGSIIAVITIAKGDVRWVKTARKATASEIRKYRQR